MGDAFTDDATDEVSIFAGSNKSERREPGHQFDGQHQQHSDDRQEEKEEGDSEADPVDDEVIDDDSTEESLARQ